MSKSFKVIFGFQGDDWKFSVFYDPGYYFSDSEYCIGIQRGRDVEYLPVNIEAIKKAGFDLREFQMSS